MIGDELMSKNWNKNVIRLGIVFTISVCICITFGELIKEWKSIIAVINKAFSAMAPIITGIVIAFLINPIMVYIRRGLARILSKKSKKYDYNAAYMKMKTISLILTMVIFLGILVGFLWLVIPRVYVSLKDLVDKMPGYLSDAQQWIEKMFAKNEKLEGQLSNFIHYVEDNVFVVFKEKVMPNLDTIVVNISSGVLIGVKFVFNFLVGLIVTIYLLGSKDELLAQGKKIIYCIFSKEKGNKILDGLSYANSVFGGFINGKILDSIIIGIICFIFTFAIKMEYAVLISVIVGVTNIIPFFGPFIGAIPGALLALMDDPIMFVIFIVWIIILQQFDGNILGPLILGDATGLSGVWVLMAILVGGDLFGVAGMILGVPVFACIYAFFAVQLRDGLRKKELSSVTADYVDLKGFDLETGEAVYRDKNEIRKTIKQAKRKDSKKLKLKKIDDNKNNNNNNNNNNNKNNKQD